MTCATARRAEVMRNDHKKRQTRPSYRQARLRIKIVERNFMHSKGKSD